MKFYKAYAYNPWGDLPWEQFFTSKAEAIATAKTFARDKEQILQQPIEIYQVYVESSKSFVLQLLNGRLPICEGLVATIEPEYATRHNSEWDQVEVYRVATGKIIRTQDY
jgi:hypothetical protein